MLQNAYFLAKIGAGTAENEQHLPNICQDSAADRLGMPPRRGRRGRRLGRADALAADPGHGLLRPRRGGGGRLRLF